LDESKEDEELFSLNNDEDGGAHEKVVCKSFSKEGFIIKD
jgi:hypothetical protein